MKMAYGLVFWISVLASQAASSAEAFLEAPGPQGPLKATLLTPEGAAGSKAPVILIIPGSGPTDRDGNNVLGIKAASLRLLAESLAQRGLSTVRIDKRGMFASGGAIPDANKVTINDYATDVHTWVNVIKNATGVRCAWVLGHSEGGLVALAAAQKPDGFCGLILVSTAGRPLGDVLRSQFRTNPANAPILADSDTAISKLERGDHVDVSSMHPALQQMFAPAVQDFLISGLSLNPATLLERYRGPVLIIQGDKDLQVGVTDAELLGKANPSAKVAVIPGVNHVLKTIATGTRNANLAAYADPSLPVAPGIADAIADVVQNTSPAKSP